MAKHDEKIDLLKSMWLFSACNRKELALIERACDEVSVSAGTVLTEEGKMGREFFLIGSGTAIVTIAGHEVAKLGAGSNFGELSLLDHQPRTATVTAVTDMDLVVLAAREFTSILEEVPTMAIRLLEATATKLREADQRAYA